MNYREEIFNAELAKQILENPMLSHAMTIMRESIKEQWVKSGCDPESGKELWFMYQLTDKFEESLKVILNTGIYAEIQNNEMQSETHQ